MADMNIRPANLKDLPAIVDIYNASIPSRLATADLVPVSVESRQLWFEKHSADHRPIWVVELSNKVVGWLSFQSFYGRPAYAHTAEVSIYVSPEYHRQGIGKFLLAKAIEQCPKLGLKTLIGFIFAHNTPSIKLFSQYHFEQWGHLPRVAELDGIERDLLILGRRIVP